MVGINCNTLRIAPKKFVPYHEEDADYVLLHRSVGVVADVVVHLDKRHERRENAASAT